MLAIKSKNKLLLLITAVLLAVGAILTSQMLMRFYQERDETNLSATSSFDFNQLYFLEYLKQFDEETLKADIITDDQVYEYRYRYGNLEDQVSNVTEQYREDLQEAKKVGDKKEVGRLTTERDEKLADLVKNFTDRDVVAQKLVKDITKNILKQKPDILKTLETRIKELDDNYLYYLKDSEGRVYKNINNVTATMSPGKIAKELEKVGAGKAMSFTSWVSPSEMNTYLDDFNNFYVGSTELSGYVTFVEGSWAEKSHQQTQAAMLRWRVILGVGIVILLAGLVAFSRYLQVDFIFPKVGHLLQSIPFYLRLMLIIGGLLAGFYVGIYLVFGIGKLAIMTAFVTLALLVYLPLLKDLWFSLRGKVGYPPLREQLKQSIVWSMANRLVDWLEKINHKTSFILIMAVVTIFSLLGVYFYGITRFVSGNPLTFAFFSALLLLGLLAMIILLQRYHRSRQLLQKPQEILSHVKDDVSPANSLAEIEDQLDEIRQIVLSSQAHHVRNEELKTELLTNVSHDLRTPLTSIITYGELLTKVDVTEENRKEYTSIINKKALRMKHLINDLFEVTKMNNGEIVLNKSEINLGQLLQQTIAEYSEDLEKAELKLLYTKPSEPLLLTIDGDRIWRVFDNLIGNVVKYAMSGTRVYLNLKEKENSAVIELKNISRYELNEGAENLVERFTRGDEARNTEGSGLGLAIAHSIVSLHGGDLVIDVDGDLFKITITLPKG